MRDLSIKARGGLVFEAEWAHTQGQARIVLGQGAGETVAGCGDSRSGFYGVTVIASWNRRILFVLFNNSPVGSVSRLGHQTVVTLHCAPPSETNQPSGSEHWNAEGSACHDAGGYRKSIHL